MHPSFNFIICETPDRNSWRCLCVHRFLVATNLEPTNARSLFPCFDEPDMKAVFNLTVIHRPETTALSNAEADSKKQINRSRVNLCFSLWLNVTFSVVLFFLTLSPREKWIYRWRLGIHTVSLLAEDVELLAGFHGFRVQNLIPK